MDPFLSFYLTIGMFLGTFCIVYCAMHGGISLGPTKDAPKDKFKYFLFTFLVYSVIMIVCVFAWPAILFIAQDNNI